MKRTAIICLVIALSTLITTGTVKAIQILGADVAVVGELQTGSLTVGEQGVGGVTFFNGTIVNETTANDGSNNPVTFGDDVRIDGRVWRGETAGAGDGKPFVINDNGEVVGNLTVGGNSIIKGNSVVKGNLGVEGYVYGGYTSTMFDQTPFKIDDQVEITGDLEVGGEIYSGGKSPGSGPINDGKPVRIDDNLVVTGEIFAIGGLDTLSYPGGDGGKISAGELSVEGYIDLANTYGQPPILDCASGVAGRMKFDPDDNKLWVCGYSGWKSFSAD